MICEFKQNCGFYLNEAAIRQDILPIEKTSVTEIFQQKLLELIDRDDYMTLQILGSSYFNWQFILKDIVKRPFITFGFISFLLLIPLVTTSTNNMVKKISYRVWKKIHMLIYIVAPLGALHFFLLTKANKIEPIIYLSIIFLLLFWRLYSKLIKN